MPNHQLHMQNLSFERNHKFLFQNFNCELNAGESLQVTGSNGSGKTTLLRILASLIEPHTGEVFWNGQSIHAQRENFLPCLNYLGHHSGIKPYLTVTENLLLARSFLAGSDPDTNIPPGSDPAVKVLDRLNLRQVQDKQAQFLSAGQLRRLAMSRLLVKPANLWILDEPLASLDKAGQDFLSELLEIHLKNNGIAIIATHQNFMSPTHAFDLGVANV